jgi:hypothetical protein
VRAHYIIGKYSDRPHAGFVGDVVDINIVRSKARFRKFRKQKTGIALHNRINELVYTVRLF